MTFPVVLSVFVFCPGGRSSHFSQSGQTGSTRYRTLLVSDKKHNGEPISPVVSSPYDLCRRSCDLQIQLLQISQSVFVRTPSPMQHSPICDVASCCTLWTIKAGASLPGFRSGVFSFILAPFVIYVFLHTSCQTISFTSSIRRVRRPQIFAEQVLLENFLGTRPADLARSLPQCRFLCKGHAVLLVHRCTIV